MTARDPVAAARALLEKFHEDHRESQTAGEGGLSHYVNALPDGSGEWTAAFRNASGRDLFDAAPALLGELAAEVERLRRDKDAAWEVIRSVKDERDRAISHAVYSSDPAAVPLDEAMRRVARGTGLDFEIVENACLTAPTAEAIAELRGNLTGLPEGETDCLNSAPDNPWPGHPVIEPDPAEAAQAEERARIEAAAREEEKRTREELRREAFERVLARLNGQWVNWTLRDLGVTREQWCRYCKTGETPEGWEPTAGLAGEGEADGR